jgi:hypothetical protein
VHRVVRGKLPVQMSPIGRQSLKNMAEPIEAYTIQLEGATAQAAVVPRPLQLATPATVPSASIMVLPLQTVRRSERYPSVRRHHQASPTADFAISW